MVWADNILLTFFNDSDNIESDATKRGENYDESAKLFI